MVTVRYKRKGRSSLSRPNRYPEIIGTLFQSFPLMVHKTEIFLCNDHEIGSLLFPGGLYFRTGFTVCHFAINQSINQSFILTRYVRELKSSFKIRPCINKIYNNYSYIILFNFKNNSINIYI